jgi:small subunit ribosomal protein S20
MFRALSGSGRNALAHHKSAKKRARQTLKRRARNRHATTTLRTAVKSARKALDGDDADATRAAVRSAESHLRRAASKGVIPAKRASRQISRLARAAGRDGA